MSNDFNFGNLDDDSLDFGSSDNAFGDSDDSFGFGSSSQDSLIPDDSFNDMFDSSQSSDNNEFQDSSNNMSDVKVTRKKAIIAIAIGIVGFLLFVLIAVKVGKDDNGDSLDKVQTTQTNKGGGGDASSVVTQQKPQQKPQQSTVVTKPASVLPDTEGWTIINNEQNIVKGEYTLLTFTATDIKHYAKQVDASGTIITKSILTGSLSGLPGTYYIEIPYDQGVVIETRPDLGIPCTFDVNVRIDNYNGTRVIGDISTYVD